MVNVLFICTANTFRSFSAEKLLEKYSYYNNLDIIVDSAGTVARPDNPYAKTIEVLSNKGCFNLENHINKKVNTDMLKWADYIICMTNKHKRIIYEDFGFESYLFNELAFDKKNDLLDDSEARFAFDLDEFIEQTIEHINKGIPNIAKKISS